MSIDADFNRPLKISAELVLTGVGHELKEKKLNLRAGLAAVCLTLLAGCSPDYNWRTVAVADGMVKALFPDKPQTQERTLDFSGHKVQFILTAATVNDAVFAVGYASLSDSLRNDEAARNEMGKAVIRSFYQNLGIAVPEVLPAFGTRFDLQGQSPKGPVKLQVITWMLPHALVEGIVTAPAASFPEEQANEFFGGLRAGQ